MNSNTENHLVDLLALKLSGDVSPQQLLQLEELLVNNPHGQFIYDQMMLPQTSYPADFATQAFAAHTAKMQLQGKLGQQILKNEAIIVKSNISIKKILLASAIAASFISILFLAFFNKNKTETPTLAVNEISTKRGSKSNIKLPDGTLVWLNADSKLSYTENFGAKNREITLLGEAYFDVKHDTLHPFIIHSGTQNIKVLGTSFNVRNYPQDKTIETTLIKGRIEITFTDKPDEKIIIHPQEKLIVTKHVALQITEIKVEKKPTVLYPTTNKFLLTNLTTVKDTLVAETSWLKDKMVFVNQPLEKIAEDLERRYAVNIQFTTNASKQYKYTGVFDNESLDEILHIITLTKKINYIIKNKNITIN